MENPSEFAKSRLREASQAKNTAQRVALFLGVAAFAMLVILSVALIDYWVRLPIAARFLGAALLLAIILRGVHDLHRLLKRPAQLKDVALDAEAQKPELGCELSTAAEYLGGERQVKHEYERELAAALEGRAAQILRRVEVPYLNHPMRSALGLGALLLTILIFAVFVPGGITAVKRAALPWSDAPYTLVEVLPGNVEIPAGRDLEIRARFSGRTPATPQLQWQEAGSNSWKSAGLRPDPGGEYVHVIKNAEKPFAYRVIRGDAVSTEYSAAVYIPPEVENWRVELRYPDYTRRSSTTQDTPEIKALRGSTALIKITPTVELSKAQIRVGESSLVNLRAVEGGAWECQLEIATNTAFRVELADLIGRPSADTNLYRITAFRDLTPMVEIHDPGRDIRARPIDMIPIKISAADDFGLEEVRLVYHRLGGSNSVVRATRGNATNDTFIAEIPLPSLRLKEYELVAYHAEASDNNALDGPGTGRSEVFFVEITAEDAEESSSQGSGEQRNLLSLQKQIIADTASLVAAGRPDEFRQLARRQEEAAQFAELYLDAMQRVGMTPDAASEMQRAIRAMEEAGESLQEEAGSPALSSEESALASLYRVLESIPKLRGMPTAPPPSSGANAERPDSELVNVVLEAIKERNATKPGLEELAEVLKEAERLSRVQSELTTSAQKIARESEDRNADRNESSPARNESSQEEDPQNSRPASEIARNEAALGKEAAALAERLSGLDGSDARLAHSAAKKIRGASNSMMEAAQAMERGEPQTAGTKGAESGAALESAIALLDRIATERPDRTHVTMEDSPDEYEDLISAYLKKLSYEE